MNHHLNTLFVTTQGAYPKLNSQAQIFAIFGVLNRVGVGANGVL